MKKNGDIGRISNNNRFYLLSVSRILGGRLGLPARIGDSSLPFLSKFFERLLLRFFLIAGEEMLDSATPFHHERFDVIAKEEVGWLRYFVENNKIFTHSILLIFVHYFPQEGKLLRVEIYFVRTYFI